MRIMSGDIGAFLRSCSNLERLEVRTEILSMMDFCLETARMKLKELKMHHSVETNEDLLKLADLMKYQKANLENLSLSFRFGGFEPSSLEMLLENIKLL